LTTTGRINAGDAIFMETKTPEQQACLMLHRTRHLLIRQQTSVINAIRAPLQPTATVGRRAAFEAPVQLSFPASVGMPASVP